MTFGDDPDRGFAPFAPERSTESDEAPMTAREKAPFLFHLSCIDPARVKRMAAASCDTSYDWARK